MLFKLCEINVSTKVEPDLGRPTINIALVLLKSIFLKSLLNLILLK